MQSFDYVRARDAAEAVHAAGAPGAARTHFLAGGTTLLDLMKLDAMQADRIVDINALQSQFGSVAADGNGLHLGGLARMADVAAHPIVRRHYPLIAQSLELAASAQIRNMATLGGNVLQRTRCNYFRDTAWRQCNKRAPGSGCAALAGLNRKHAVLGVSGNCIASYPGDFAQALVALDATVQTIGPGGARRFRFADLHTLPGDRPDVETILAPGEMITGFDVPAGPWNRRSLFLKIRDRQSYEFALTSAAVALDMDGKTVRTARIALGGVAAKPWRAHEAEAALGGQVLTPETASYAAAQAFAGAVTHGQNDFKPELGRRTLVRALLQAQSIEA